MRKMLIFITEIYICIMCYYLTEKIAEYTLTTQMQYACVFVYFLLFSNLLFYIMRKHENGFRCEKWMVLFVLVSTISLFDHTSSYRETTVTIDDLRKSDFVEENRIWLSDIFVDGKSIDLSQFQLTEGWSYNSEWDDIMSDMSEREALELKIPRGEEVKIRFVYYDDFLETTNIYDGDELIDNSQLYADDSEGLIMDVSSNLYELNMLMRLGKYTFYLFVICCIVFLVDKSKAISVLK